MSGSVLVPGTSEGAGERVYLYQGEPMMAIAIRGRVRAPAQRFWVSRLAQVLN